MAYTYYKSCTHIVYGHCLGLLSNYILLYNGFCSYTYNTMGQCVSLLYEFYKTCFTALICDTATVTILVSIMIFLTQIIRIQVHISYLLY